jgi:hypothetical protein
MTHRLVKAPRGKYIGKLVGKPSESEAAHFMPCPKRRTGDQSGMAGGRAACS